MRALALFAVTSLCGCSIVLGHEPPRAPQPGVAATCDTFALPVLDTAMTGLAGFATGLALYHGLNPVPPNPDEGGVSGPLLVAGVTLAVETAVFAASAVVGYHRAARCHGEPERGPTPQIARATGPRI